MLMTTTLAETVERFRAEPAAARSTPAVTATLLNGHARLSAGPFNWEADLPGPIGGGNLAPSPTAYLLGALAACAVVFLRDTLGPQFGVTIDALTATASCAADQRGLLGMDGAAPDLTDMRITIDVTTSDAPERTEAMLAAWRERCPIYLALLNRNAVAFEARVAAAA